MSQPGIPLCVSSYYWRACMIIIMIAAYNPRVIGNKVWAQVESSLHTFFFFFFLFFVDANNEWFAAPIDTNHPYTIRNVGDTNVAIPTISNPNHTLLLG
jgi:hypothetical protein